MTLNISMLKKGLPLAYLNTNTRHLSLRCSITSPPCTLVRKTIISSIQYATLKCQNVHIFHPIFLLMLMNNIILTIIGCDTYKPPGI